MKPLLLLFSILCLSMPLQAEEPQAQKTELEMFNAKSGSVIIKGYSTVAKIDFKNESSLEIDVKEYNDASSGERRYGITVAVNQGGRVERKETAYIDEAEIDSLVKGIDYISKIDKSATKLDNFEAQYKTKGSLSIVVFNSANSKLMAGISAGRIGTASVYMELLELNKIRDGITKAKELIEAVKK